MGSSYASWGLLWTTTYCSWGSSYSCSGGSKEASQNYNYSCRYSNYMWLKSILLIEIHNFIKGFSLLLPFVVRRGGNQLANVVFSSFINAIPKSTLLIIETLLSHTKRVRIIFSYWFIKFYIKSLIVSPNGGKLILWYILFFVSFLLFFFHIVAWFLLLLSHYNPCSSITCLLLSFFFFTYHMGEKRIANTLQSSDIRVIRRILSKKKWKKKKNCLEIRLFIVNRKRRQPSRRLLILLSLNLFFLKWGRIEDRRSVLRTCETLCFLVFIEQKDWYLLFYWKESNNGCFSRKVGIQSPYMRDTFPFFPLSSNWYLISVVYWWCYFIAYFVCFFAIMKDEGRWKWFFFLFFPTSFPSLVLCFSAWCFPL